MEAKPIRLTRGDGNERGRRASFSSDVSRETSPSGSVRNVMPRSWSPREDEEVAEKLSVVVEEKEAEEEEDDDDDDDEGQLTPEEDEDEEDENEQEFRPQGQ